MNLSFARVVAYWLRVQVSAIPRFVSAGEALGLVPDRWLQRVRCILVLDGVQSGFKLQTEQSVLQTQLLASAAVPWFADQALGSIVVVILDDKLEVS
eukprot:6213673-Pleurochrysis_carterae.AAC.1